MLSSIDVKFIFDSTCLSASLGDKGLFSPANILQSRCRPSSCLVAVLFFFLICLFISYRTTITQCILTITLIILK